MDTLTAFGLLAVTAMLVFYALEYRSPWFILAFSGSCVLASTYDFRPNVAQPHRTELVASFECIRTVPFLLQSSRTN